MAVASAFNDMRHRNDPTAYMTPGGRLAKGGLRVILIDIFLVGIVVGVIVGICGCAPSKQHGLDTADLSKLSDKELGAEERALQQAIMKDELQNSDCVKCHDSEPADIARAGGKHQSKLTCRECHLEHPPQGTNVIPKCSRCHNKNSQEHFKLPNCLGCHRNPHTPLDVTVDDTPQVSAGCKTCHPEKGEEFKKFPSKHATKNCTFCHPKKHKQIKKCLECHQPHADFMVFKDCLRCHKPHSPLNIHYADDIPNQYCGSCHKDEFALLSKSKAKHGAFKCAFCHKDKHPTVPKCTDCHQQPHDISMLKAVNSDCLKCHKDPHDLVF